MQILILGMHRSGTSAITRLINLMGAYFGPEGSDSGVTEANPKGYWERFDIYTLNDALLKAKGCSWHDLKAWTFEKTADTPGAIAKRMQKIVLGMDAFRPWVLKDPRLCLLLPAWRPFLEVPVAVIVHRNPLEIASSLEKRDGFPLAYGLALWEYYAVGLLNATRGIPRIYLRHADMLQRPVKTCEALHKWLKDQGVRRLEMPSPKEIRAFIDPTLYRSRPKTQLSPLSPQQQALALMLQGKQSIPKVLQVSEETQAIMRKGMQC